MAAPATTFREFYTHNANDDLAGIVATQQSADVMQIPIQPAILLASVGMQDDTTSTAFVVLDQDPTQLVEQGRVVGVHSIKSYAGTVGGWSRGLPMG